MGETAISDISPFRLTKYFPHSRAALTSVSVAVELTQPSSMGFKPTFLRVHPTDGDVLVEVADRQTAPATPAAGSYRITNGNPEWVQIPFDGRVSIIATSGTVLTSLIWAG